MTIINSGDGDQIINTSNSGNIRFGNINGPVNYSNNSTRSTGAQIAGSLQEDCSDGDIAKIKNMLHMNTKLRTVHDSETHEETTQSLWMRIKSFLQTSANLTTVVCGAAAAVTALICCFDFVQYLDSLR